MLLLLVALASLSLPLMDVQPTDMGGVLQQLTNQFATATTQLLTAVDTATIEITRVAYVTALLIGVLLYFTRIHRRLGRDLITGGIILAILSEFLLPLITKL